MTLHHTVDKPADFVFDQLTDMQKYAAVHPVIYRIEHLEGVNYKIFEKLRVGFIPYSFTYPATVMSDIETKNVVMKAVVMNVATVEMTFTIEARGNKCLVNEKINIQSALPLKKMMQNIFREQHVLLFKNIENA